MSTIFRIPNSKKSSEKRKRVSEEIAVGKQIREKYAQRVADISTSVLKSIEDLHAIDQDMIDEAQKIHDEANDPLKEDIDVLRVVYDVAGENDGITYDDAGNFFSGLRMFAQEHISDDTTTED